VFSYYDFDYGLPLSRYIGSRHFLPEEQKPIYRPVALRGLISALLVDGGERSARCNGRFIPVEWTPCTHWKLAESQKRSRNYVGWIKLTTPSSVYRNSALRSTARGLVTIDYMYTVPARHLNNHDILMLSFWIYFAFQCAASQNLCAYVGNAADLASALVFSYSCGLL
jgi:hypothetical protein